ncbi:serine/threonine-protein kinase [Bifidobacterium jacchi]|uniref:non-specific serine/threonine protein kinase n=1 Tax=Bifidobacterium jacchi TaxID=2490545 RepID=A0A5N5RMR1_9BIFI|nr:serine/threonine-protein kinase [Bifidobacterium jacchi]KAB5608577.1 serine/threonine protein kinase [Bifidobacterium jacchi]
MSDVTALNLEPGEVVGGYTLMSRLGSGAMGSVWRVRDDGGQQYAMKILRDSLAEGEPDDQQVTARERLRREAMALKKVNHPGVCAIVDMELDDSLAFIVTELIEGRNLREDVAANGRYVGDDLERLARKLIEAVRAVHAAGIVHRDIKPTNVMVSASGPVLVDFGIAMGEGESHVTRTGLVMGTPGFIAPEIIEGAESDETTDWWSVASVLAFAATGTPVFGTKPMMAVLERAASGNAHLAGLPARTMAAFRAALDPDRRRRCSPEQLLHAIAVDALNPFAWNDGSDNANSGNDNDNGGILAPPIPPKPGTSAAPAIPATPAAPAIPANPANATADDRTGVMRPFDEPDLDNPRSLWRSEPRTDVVGDTVGGAANDVPDDAVGTVAVSAYPQDSAEPRTIAYPASDLAPAAAVSAASSVPTAVVAATQTPASSDAIMPQQTTMMSTPATVAMQPRVASEGGGNVPAFLARQAPTEATLTPAAPTVVAPARQTAPVQPPTPATQYAPPQHAPTQYAPDQYEPSQYAPNPYAPHPVDAARARIRHGGVAPTLLASLPIAALASNMPIIALIIATMLVWVLSAVGYGVEPQLRREWRRGGGRKASDLLLSLGSLPLRLARALGQAAARGVLMAGLMTLIIILATLLAGLPTTNATVGGMAIPLPAGSPSSGCGIGCAIGCGVGWLAAMLLFPPSAAQFGMGALRTGASLDAPRTAQPLDATGGAHLSIRDIAMLIVWAAVMIAGITMAATGNGIDWQPLM